MTAAARAAHLFYLIPFQYNGIDALDRHDLFEEDQGLKFPAGSKSARSQGDKAESAMGRRLQGRPITACD
jgi:hypothetical protein